MPLPADLSDPELIVRTIDRDDRGAFGELVLRHQSCVRCFLRKLLRGDAAAADDLAQQTFITAFKNLARFRGQASFRTWLLGIAHNEFRNEKRKRQEIPYGLQSADTATMIAPSGFSDGELSHALGNALQKLDIEEALALHLCYQTGLTHIEAAAVLGVPIGTLKTHVLRGKEQLRRLLAAWNPGHEL